MQAAPRYDIDPAAFWENPYPDYTRLRNEAPVAFVPQLGAVLLSRRDDVFHWEKEIEVFSSDQPGGLMTRLMGQNMMRKDGPEHMAERKVYVQAISPKAVADVWGARFQGICDRLLDALPDSGSADLVQDFALPYAGECLREMLGLETATAADLDAWSQAMMDGIANYTGDAAVEARCVAATAAIDRAIDAMLPRLADTPATSLLSVMVASGMPEAQVRANIKLSISGGQNEPRKAIAGCIWALLTHPDQYADLEAGRASWRQALEEFLRWMSPIAMSPRRIAQSVTLNGVTLEPETRAFLMFGAANHDERHFDRADAFDIHRNTTKAVSFGAGPHFCAGAWASRAMIADVALPTVFRRLEGLKVTRAPRIGGWAFRGLMDLPAAWDRRRPAGAR
jgi:cytochrome P450